MKDGGDIRFRAVAYCRVSTFDQVYDAVTIRGSLQEQEEIARKYAASAGWEYYGTYVEPGVSGEKFDERKALQSMLDDARKGVFDAVIIKAGDRLARDQEIYFRITKIINQFYNIQILNLSNPAQIVAPDEFNGRRNPMLIVQQGFDAMMAAFDNARRTEMLMEGKRRQIRAGRYISSTVFYGYKIDYQMSPTGKIDRIPVPDPDEYRYLKMIPGFVIEERLTAREIALRLDALGAKPKLSDRWSKVSVLGLINQPFYAGKLMYGKTTVKLNSDGKAKKVATQKPEKVIMTDHQYEHPWDWATREKMLDIRSTRVKQAPRVAVSRSPLAGILKCGFCGHNMAFRVSAPRTVPHGGRQDRYRCGLHNNKPSLCRLNDVYAQFIFDGIIADIEELLEQRNRDRVNFYDGLHAKDNSALYGEVEAMLAAARKELAETIPNKIDRLNRAFLNDKVSEDQFAELTRLINEDRDRVAATIRQLEEQTNKIMTRTTRKAAVDKFLDDARQYTELLRLPVCEWPELAPRKVRDWLAGHYESITVKLYDATDKNIPKGLPPYGRQKDKRIQIVYKSVAYD
jgi:DNA invertase Pin-like site-specific DNA recombinase